MSIILTYNVNGVRAALRKGFAEWIKSDKGVYIVNLIIDGQSSHGAIKARKHGN